MIVQKYQDSTRRQNNFENARGYQSFLGGIPTKHINKISSVGSNYGGFTKFVFHVFDRYEIHIQAFVDFIDAIAIISKSSSSQSII